MTTATAHHRHLRRASRLDRLAVRLGMLLVHWGRRDRHQPARETAMLRRAVERELREEAARRVYDVYRLNG